MPEKPRSVCWRCPSTSLFSRRRSAIWCGTACQWDLPSLQRAYALYKRQLEFLAAEKGENKRWALKCPAHLPYVSDLLKEFPDARIVWTHRDPRESIPSLCSMFRTFADMSERGPVDLEAIGREQVAFWGAACDRALNVECCDVAYADLVRDPVAVVAVSTRRAATRRSLQHSSGRWNRIWRRGRGHGHSRPRSASTGGWTRRARAVLGLFGAMAQGVVVHNVSHAHASHCSTTTTSGASSSFLDLDLLFPFFAGRASSSPARRFSSASLLAR